MVAHIPHFGPDGEVGPGYRLDLETTNANLRPKTQILAFPRVQSTASDLVWTRARTYAHRRYQYDSRIRLLHTPFFKCANGCRYTSKV